MKVLRVGEIQKESRQIAAEGQKINEIIKRQLLQRIWSAKSVWGVPKVENIKTEFDRQQCSKDFLSVFYGKSEGNRTSKIEHA